MNIKYFLYLFVFLSLFGCAQEKPKGKYLVTIKVGFATGNNYCDSYKIRGKKVYLYDENGELISEASLPFYGTITAIKVER